MKIKAKKCPLTEPRIVMNHCVLAGMVCKHSHIMKKFFVKILRAIFLLSGGGLIRFSINNKL